MTRKPTRKRTRKPFPKSIEAAVFLASRRRCAQCGREGISLAYQQGLLSKSTKWFVKYRCPACGHEWEREDKSK
jgi:hypothetical protein